MAVFTRTNGNAQNVVSVGNITLSTEASTVGTIVSTGIGKPIQAWGLTTGTSSWDTNTGTGEAVELALRAISFNATVLAYQTNDTLLSVLVEDNSWTATNMKANVEALLTASSFSWTITPTNVGLKLATS
jgi:hypothetical protein